MTWFILGGFCILIVFIQTLTGHYGDKVSDVWSWLLPSLMPTLSLIVAVLVSDALGPTDVSRSIERFLFALTLGISVLYLLCIDAVILMSPLTKQPVFETMQNSNLFLGPFQGLVASALGVFFTRRG